METQLYDEDLVIRKFKSLGIKEFAKHVKAGDFKILIDTTDPQKPRRIIRWSNTSVFGPNHKFVSILITEIFHGVPNESIEYRGLIPCGFEITAH